MYDSHQPDLRKKVGMSIWTSVGLIDGPDGDDVLAVDLGHPDTDVYRGSGPEDVMVDVSHATTWNQKIRLSLFERDHAAATAAGKRPVDVDVMLDRHAARQLRDQLDRAIQIVDKEYPPGEQGPAAVVEDPNP